MLSIALGTSSCRTLGIKWKPEWHSINSETQMLVYCPSDTDIPCVRVPLDIRSDDDFQCLHNYKILELREILKRARIPKSYKKKAQSFLPNDLGPTTFRQ